MLSDIPGAIRAAEQILKVRQVVIPKCGHAPQIEKARLVNQLVVRYLKDKLKVSSPRARSERFLILARSTRSEVGRLVHGRARRTSH